MAELFTDTLSAPTDKKFFISSTPLIPPPTVSGTKHSFAVLSIISTIANLFSCVAVISRKVISSAPFSL